MNIAAFKTTFDGVLQTYVDEKISQSKQLLGNDKLNKIISYIETFIFSGGKRIRPFCLWSVYM
jgi:geranylgeranyl pyrophosphate synthase